MSNPNQQPRESKTRTPNPKSGFRAPPPPPPEGPKNIVIKESEIYRVKKG